MKHIKTKYELFKQKIYIIIYGSNTFAGRLFDLVLLGVILLSVLLVMLESVEKQTSRKSIWTINNDVNLLLE